MPSLPKREGMTPYTIESRTHGAGRWAGVAGPDAAMACTGEFSATGLGHAAVAVPQRPHRVGNHAPMQIAAPATTTYRAPVWGVQPAQRDQLRGLVTEALAGYEPVAVT